MEIIRNKVIEFKPYVDRADKIFLKIYDELEWTTLYRFRKARRLSMLYVDDIRQKMTDTCSVVISRSEKKLNAVDRYWLGISEAISSIEKIKK
jgi:hypothetical protein